MKLATWVPWLGLGALLLIVVWWGRPLKTEVSRVDFLPTVGAAYRSVDLPLEGAETKFFNGARVVKRLYRFADRSALVVLGIDGANNRHAVHDPLFCFRGAGWDVMSRERIELPRGEGARVQLRRGTESGEVIFWFSDGQTQHAQPQRAWLQSSWRRMTRGASGSEPVLIVVQPAEGGRVPWESALRWMSVLREW